MACCKAATVYCKASMTCCKHSNQYSMLTTLKYKVQSRIVIVQCRDTDLQSLIVTLHHQDAGLHCHFTPCLCCNILSPALGYMLGRIDYDHQKSPAFLVLLQTCQNPEVSRFIQTKPGRTSSPWLYLSALNSF